jgi:alcohol oxidase
MLGGTAGSVIAGRLAKADPSLQILIIESGLDNRNDPNIYTPAHFLRQFHPDNKSVEFYVSKPTSGIPDRNIITPVGNVLGGGTSVNVMQYTRGSASDYDDWNAEGWSFADLKPLFKKVCKFMGWW